MHIMLTVEGSNQVFSNTLDLKNPYFRYNGQVAAPPGNHHESPTEYYLNQIANMSVSDDANAAAASGAATGATGQQSTSQQGI